MRGRAAFVILIAMTACAGAPKTPPKIHEVPIERPDANAPPPLPHRWQKTAELIRDPEMQKKVDDFAVLTLEQMPSAEDTIALMPRVDSEGTGVGGSKSAAYAAYEDLEATLAPADAVALIRHESPAVRAYFSEYVIFNISNGPMILYSLFGDTTPIETLNGCLGKNTTVADYALNEVLAYGKPVIDSDGGHFLKLVVGDTRLAPHTRGSALAYLAGLDPKAAHPIALAAAHDSDLKWRREGIRALGVVGDPKDIDLLTTANSSDAWQDREQVIAALDQIDTPAARDKLFALMDDNPLAVYAANAYARKSSVTDDDLIALLNTTVALGHLGDRASIPALRKQLFDAKPQHGGHYLAADALGDLKATEATDDLIKSLNDENFYTTIAAATALAKIGAVRALPAIEAAAAKAGTYEKPKILDAVAKLQAAKTNPKAKP
jgi:HEAT repeat protein